MDFSPPAIQHFVHLPFDVPYVADHANSTHGQLRFSDYPVRAGHTVENLLSADVGGKQTPFDDLAPFLQSWLFFGILEELFGSVLGIEVATADFIHEKEDGSRILSLDRLPKYLLYWIALEAPTFVDRRRLPLATDCLRAANRVLNTLARRPVAGGTGRAGHKTLLAAIILAEALDRSRRQVYVLDSGPGGELGWECSGYGRMLLLEAGWCPGEVYMLQITRVATLAYIASFDRHQLRKSHARCTDRRCEAYQIDERVYQTRHATEGCRCAHVVVESENHRPITAMLKGGGIPVIALPKAPDGTEAVVIQESSAATPYVAISHVWSDGLGNASGNSLPMCQLRRLQRLVDGLFPAHDGPVPFWIDTICVPFSDMKKHAIRKMAMVYKDASKTLVLDRSLEISSLHRPIDELLTRIRCTPWMQRLWTVQEAVLSKDLYFQFADGPFHPDTFVIADHSNKTAADLISQYLRPLSRSTTNAAIERTIYKALLAEYASEFSEETFDGHEDFLGEMFDAIAQDESSAVLSNLDGVYLRLIGPCAGLQLKSPLLYEALGSYLWLREDVSTGHHALSYIAQVLRMRTSSKLGDETICIATLLDLDPTPLFSVPDGARMQTLLGMMSWVPAALAFADTPRLAAPGFRWAPRSLMWREARYDASLNLSNTENSGRVEPGRGLRMRYPVECFTAPGGLGAARAFNLHHPRPNQSEFVSCVTLKQAVGGDAAHASPLAVVRPNNALGAVIEIMGEEAGVLMTRFLTTATLTVGSLHSGLPTFVVEQPVWGQVRELYVG